MRKISLFIAICLLGTMAGQFALAATEVVQKVAGLVSVSTSSTKEIDPNYAEMTFALETSAKTVDQATAENNTKSNKIIDAVKPKIDEKAGETIKTEQYSVRPDYIYTKDNKRILSGYTVVNSMKIKLTNVKKAGSIIDLVVASGANRLENVNFGFSSNQNMCNDMYPQLVKDAQNQASIIARALNKNVTGVKNISTSCSTQYENNMRVMYSAKSSVAQDAAGLNAPVEPGKIKVFASINADFNIE